MHLSFEISKSGMDFSVPSPLLARGRNCPSTVEISLRFPRDRPPGGRLGIYGIPQDLAAAPRLWRFLLTSAGI